MYKKVLIMFAVLAVGLMFVIPSDANPSDVLLDQQVELKVPGVFELVDADQDKKTEVLKFKLGINAYREGNFIVTGNLEALKDGNWVALGTTVVPFQWSPDNQMLELSFYAGSIKKAQLDGPYRVSISLKEGEWQLPEQVAGFSEKIAWQSFGDATKAGEGDIASVSEAKRAVETWAKYNSLKLGKLIDMNYNYDHWQLNYQSELKNKINRFLVSPGGNVQMMWISRK